MSKDKKFNFFNRRQFISYILSVSALTNIPKISLASNPDVIVIGAGASGLAATEYLLQKGKSVICIEANNRIGGRCYTDNSIFGVPYDVGAHWITNNKTNPYVHYWKKNDIKSFNLYQDQEQVTVYDGKKKLISPEDKPLWDQYNSILEDIGNSSNKDIAPSEAILNKNSEWYDTAHLIIGPYDMAKDFNHFSCMDWWNYLEPETNSWFCSEGYGTLVKHKWRGVPVQLNTKAKTIKWDGQGVQIETNKGTISSKACILTLSTGVLSSGKLKFIPKLPMEKYDSFAGISMGIYNHIALQFNKNFFPHSKDGYIYYKLKNKNKTFPKGVAGLTNSGSSNLSYFDTGGEFARELENAGKETSIDFVLGELKSIFGSKIDKCLINAHATSWASNPFTLGSYASAEPGAFHLRKVLKESVGDRIFIAGEATADEWATVAGATRSGLRAAKEVIKIL
ncbi:FAD-dependent oxidoreductase [Alphaproteobacteria bacterium]|nr:FAD-dependent oxidoreductase [Alphaproteobacteria bacterium]